MIQNIAFGVDLGWVSQLESRGYRWVDFEEKPVDPIRTCKDMGADAVRLRIFVNPPSQAYWQKNETTMCMLGFCDAKSVLEVSKRVKALNMDLMLDFHYSDHFADPLIQDIPKEWENDDEKMLAEHVYGHTKQTLAYFKENDIEPRWVQVGNEINNGIMWPMAGLKDNPKLLVECLNRGYEAVKEVFPNCRVITHLASVEAEALCEPFLENFVKNNGKTDILGFSYYPYWGGFKSNKEELLNQLNYYQKKYHYPVMVVEVGGVDKNENESFNMMCDVIEAVSEVPNYMGQGVFFWEPDATREILPDAYPLCAAKLVGDKVLQYTKTITAYGEYK